MPLLTVNDSRLNVVDCGRGPPLLLVHGFPLDHRMWQEQIDDLGRDVRVIAPDLRGFGGSSVTAGTVTMAQLADDLAACLDALGVREPAVVCGLSMGGYIAWQFWRRHRGRLAGLILCDTRAGVDSPEVARGRLATAARLVAEGVELLADTMLARLVAPATHARRPAVLEAARRMILATPADGAAAVLRGMAQREDFSAALSTIDVPTLVLCGAHDAISPVAEMGAMAARIPGAQFAVIPDAGHLAPLENPSAVNAAIRAFLANGGRQAPGG